MQLIVINWYLQIEYQATESIPSIQGYYVTL